MLGYFPYEKRTKKKQAGAELRQAQLKLGLDISVDLVTLDLICSYWLD